ncbi:tRNA uridine-5-carboxymethylaminomethyl(34) synthesis GTPase MnmE [Paramaledivibacter caminithermalis]|jgi:tRNA modification GTPase|uniref:tRNA modification GTPase MnmE n=1 Tax=Paramaledivibacter caminithermalis (strain DSM 15212 / CIP 107654 / DViRD3) TaxID=1121301 RepID=A0A1M6NY52_PARC5|nr:tRNA uridine-5-carboxymethylaminomethyl(34) synthesis GTPase MnmE [Paramaledivibacter caminithermalis]SHK00633.1 tRNA modification GTPase trmE [Paramaledivibacter caminithermalis DSM 15212]
MIDDTIAAIATAPGEAGISIIRISGSKAIDILDSIFKTKKEASIRDFSQRRLVYGHIVDREKNKILDEVLAVYMKAPYTYTKEDTVEINCHGGIVPTRNILELVLRKGARMADPGEFTKRAFLNGRIDLAQAEAVIDLIKAKTNKGFDVALSQLEGSISRNIKDIRDIILQTLAHLHVSIDYTEEDIEEITYPQLLSNMEIVKEKIKRLLDTSETGKIIREGLNTVIIGKPNVGKSSLLNALLKESRAIVTDIPGTTRDVIEENLSIRGIPLKIVDTAGIRDTDDIVERMGVERSKEFFNKADLVILVLDASEDLTKEDNEIIELINDRRAIVLLNKTDLPQRVKKEDLQKLLPNKKIIQISILQEKGLNEIEEEIVKMVYGGHIKEMDISFVTNVRHKNSLERAAKSIEEGLEAVKQELPYDLIEVDIKDCYDALGEITGDTVDDNIIDKIFANFCLGK